MTVDAREIAVHVSEATEKSSGYPDQVPEPPSFCRCGRPLVRRDEKAGHDTDTGKQRYVTTWRCSWTVGLLTRGLLIFRAHDEYVLKKFVDWRWVRRMYETYP